MNVNGGLPLNSLTLICFTNNLTLISQPAIKYLCRLCYKCDWWPPRVNALEQSDTEDISVAVGVAHALVDRLEEVVLHLRENKEVSANLIGKLHPPN